MAEMVTDTSPAGMTAAIAEGITACLQLLASVPGGEARTEDGLTLAITRLPMPVFNGVFRAQIDPSLPDAEIDRRIGAVVAYLRSQGIPFGWWVMPDDRPSDLRARLVTQGFIPEEEQPAMAIDLNQLGPVPEIPKDTVIEEMREFEGLAEHIRLVAVGFELPSEIETAFQGTMQGLPIGPGTPVRCFLAHEHGRPVGTSLVVLAGRAAAIFNVVTVPEARGRGIGALVTDAALRAAREAGHRIAILESSHIGYNVYRRLGFAEYGQIAHFTWSGEADT
jgi:GNAT superfamily N-acetyltransferase